MAGGLLYRLSKGLRADLYVYSIARGRYKIRYSGIRLRRSHGLIKISSCSHGRLYGRLRVSMSIELFQTLFVPVGLIQTLMILITLSLAVSLRGGSIPIQVTL